MQHRYEFSRNARKSYLLERNRLLLLLTAYERRTLLAARCRRCSLVEAALLALAVAQGWGGAKLRGYGWLLRHRGLVLARRRQLQAERTRPDAALLPLLTAHLSFGNVDRPPGLGLLDAVLAGYWALARRALA